VVRRLADDLLELAHGTGTGPGGGDGDAAEAIALVVDEIARDPKWTDAEIRVQPLPSVELPQSLLVTVLRNLVRNALEAGARRVDVFARPGGTICVRDDGPGISAAEAIRVFGVYSGKAGGAGVGLRLCRDLLRRRRGEIWLERPSTFAFRVG
jgi:signal transduction histidine kinase